MTTFSVPLDLITVASPCEQPWATMAGDDRVRHCRRCDQHVYNLSELSRTDAEALIARHAGAMCVRFARRVDGTVVTRECPPLRVRARRWVVWTGMAIAAMAIYAVWFVRSMTTGNKANFREFARQHEPLRTVAEWIDPTPQVYLAGAICIPCVPINSTVPPTELPSPNTDNP